MSPSDTTLLEQWRNRRDADAFRTLIQRHAPMVYATCKRILKNAHDAEDTAQDCFITLTQTPADSITHIPGWLHRIATNRSLDRLKSDRRRREREERLIDERIEQDSVQWDDVQHFVDEAIAALPDVTREIIVAYFLESRTQSDIAGEYGISRQAIAQRIEKGIEIVRDSLREKGVIVGATALSAMLTENCSAAVPASLAAALGKLALAGAGNLATASAAPIVKNIITGGLAVKKSLALAGIVTAILAVGWYANLAKQTVNSRPQSQKVVEHKTADTPASPDNAIASSTIQPASSITLQSPSLEPGEIENAAEYASVSGTVLDAENHPIPNAQISVFAPGVSLSGPDSEDGASLDRILGNTRHVSHANTGANGHYKVSDIRFSGKPGESLDLGTIQAQEYQPPSETTPTSLSEVVY